MSASAPLWTASPSSKPNGYHLEHGFDDGRQPTGTMFAAVDMLAFAIHTVRDRLERIRAFAAAAERVRTRLSEHLRTITACLAFPNWNAFMGTLVGSKPRPGIQAQPPR